jgi:glucosamine-6-phosphate deaminase
MELIIVESRNDLGATAAAIITEQVRAEPETVLGVATGSSPLPAYAHLEQNREADFSRVTCFALDEYVGLPADHTQSYAYFVNHHIAGPLQIPPSRVRVPQGDAADLEKACIGYEKEIESSGGIDLQILGIGRNGHLAFNEPGAPLNSRTRVVRLTDSTREANARFFTNPAAVPTHAITEGLGTLLEARRLLLVASGSTKAKALHQAINGSVSPDCPASVIQLHQHVTVIADREAARLLGAVHAPVKSR